MAVVSSSSFHSALLAFSSPSIAIPILNPMNGEKRRRRSSYSTRLQCSSRPDDARRISEQSSWKSKDSEGKDYLYRLGQEADNMNIAVGARQGVIDDLFVGNFLGKDSDIVFDYRQKATRSFEYLQGDYYIAPAFLNDTSSLVGYETCHIVKNYIAHLLNVKVPLILGIWGGKGQGKTFQTELIFRAMGIEPVIMSAGELESERAGDHATLRTRLIRDRYRTASQVIQNQVRGKMSCLMINDIDAGLGRFGNTQMTVNNQIVVGTLMNLSDNPTRVSIGQKWRESDVVHRVPIIVTGNDFSTLYAPLIRDGRMEKFYWLFGRKGITEGSRVPQMAACCKYLLCVAWHMLAYLLHAATMETVKFLLPSTNIVDMMLIQFPPPWQPDHEDIINIVHQMYAKDGITRDEVIRVVDTFPNQALDFYGALRSRTYDQSILKWVNDTSGYENLVKSFSKERSMGSFLLLFLLRQQSVEALLESGHSLVKEHHLITNSRLSKEYMKNIDD
ncbi:ATPase family associated with various cellular activities (AAA) [Musa troglodytarum]|uniref:Ribulose bisphosphate carboxylase/oxygenase activase, chloroplastic n=1 Tax=Musa troglodytarum TaxID=320322 RepID=A0A9E7KWG2_9LILI|nr:ATPase family associated with various cellular activities (AAA) [Musa troglodytarum]